jgi:hypothetical protein
VSDTRSRPRRDATREKREVDFYVRAKTGPGRQDWSGIGVAFKTDNGYSVKLNTLPINMAAWDGVLVLVPPFADGEEPDTRGD